MYSINFDINETMLSCQDTERLKRVPEGTKNYIEFLFTHSKDWRSMSMIIAVFKNEDTQEEEAVLLKDNRCIVPDKFCNMKHFSLHIVGQRADTRIKTNKAYLLLGGV